MLVLLAHSLLIDQYMDFTKNLSFVAGKDPITDFS